MLHIVHVLYDYTYADASQRTAASGFSASDIGKLALQADNDSVWVLTATTPTWLQINSGTTGRLVLTADTTFYVSTTGSDTTGSGTSGAPWATVQKAVDYITGYIDPSQYQVTIKLADGTYTVTSTIFLRPNSFAKPPIILGNTSTPANVVVSLSGGGDLWQMAYGGAWIIKALKYTATSGNGTYVKAGSLILDNCVLGACAANTVFALLNGAITVQGGTTITGTHSVNVFVTRLGGNIYIAAQNITFSSATCTLVYLFSGTIYALGLTFTGTFTGQRYSVNGNGVLETGGSGVNYFPGTIAGATTTGGQYL